MNANQAAKLIEPLRKQRVVFGHQSVGADILQGVAQLSAAAGSPVRILETRKPTAGPGLFHFKVGTNGAPEQKLRDFASAFADPAMASIDVALVKLCYIDFNDGANPEQLADAYLATLRDLRAQHPQTRFLVVTTPLTTVQTGPKAWVKRLLRRAPAGYEANALRHTFNEALRRGSTPSDLFDLAKVESEASGRPVTFDFDGYTIPALDPALTYDGGHLNNAGKTTAATRLLQTLEFAEGAS